MAETEKRTYTYAGAVQVWDRVDPSTFRASTCAPSLAKARSNLIYQYKQRCNLSQKTPVKLLGEIKLVA